MNVIIYFCALEWLDIGVFLNWFALKLIKVKVCSTMSIICTQIKHKNKTYRKLKFSIYNWKKS